VEAVLLLVKRENKTKGTEKGKNVFTTIQSKDGSQNNTEKRGEGQKMSVGKLLFL